MDQSLLAAPHDFSQLTASFFGSWRLGIHQYALHNLTLAPTVYKRPSALLSVRALSSTYFQYDSVRVLPPPSICPFLASLRLNLKLASANFKLVKNPNCASLSYFTYLHMRGNFTCFLLCSFQGTVEHLCYHNNLFISTSKLWNFQFQNQQLPNLPGRFQPSTFGVCGLNYCVRYGNRWNPTAIVTGFMVETSGIEPLTPCLQGRCSPS